MLTELPLPLWQFDSKTEKVSSLSPGRGTFTNKCVLNLIKPTENKRSNEAKKK